MIFSDCDPSASLTDIADIERKIGCRLPEDYRTHLLNFNGGYPKPEDTFDATTRFGRQPDGDVRFYAVGPDAIDDLPSGIDAFRDRAPNDCIPIAMTGCGNQVFLGIAGERRGKIFYYDLEDEQDEEDTDDPPQCFYPLADSLADFLAMLYEYKDEAE